MLGVGNTTYSMWKTPHTQCEQYNNWHTEAIRQIRILPSDSEDDIPRSRSQ